jgi:hypothetical protein
MAVLKRARKTQIETERESRHPVDAVVPSGNELDTICDRHERSDAHARSIADIDQHRRIAIGVATHDDPARVDKSLQFARLRRRVSEVIAEPCHDPA